MLFSPHIAYNRYNVFIIMSILLFRLSGPRNKIHTQLISAQSEASTVKCQLTMYVLIEWMTLDKRGKQMNPSMDEDLCNIFYK